MEILNQIQIKKMDNSTFYKYSKTVGTNVRKLKNHFVSLLPEISRRGIYKKDFATITEFAAKVGGVGKKTVQAVFQLEKHLEDKPLLKELIPEVGVNKVRVVATIATKENQEEMARKVKTMTKRALEEVARNMRKIDAGEGMGKGIGNGANADQNNTLFDQSAPGSTSADNENTVNKREYFGFHVDKKNALEFRKFKQKLEKEKKEKIDFNEVLGELLKIAEVKPGGRLKQVQQQLQNSQEEPRRARQQLQKPESRHISVVKKRNLNKKHNGCCVFPGCNRPFIQIHHPDRFAINKSHNKIVPLCDIHHELAHQGLIGNEEKLPTEWYIKENPDRNHPKYKIDQKVIAHKILAFKT